MKTLLAVPITRLDPPPAEQIRAASQAGADLVELRVDGIAHQHGRNGLAIVENLLRQDRRTKFILTVRAAAEGGHWDGSEAERISWIERLASLQPDYVDVEYATWSASPNLRERLASIHAAAATKLILSHHDTRGTPQNLEALYARLADTTADVVKVVFTARDATDALRVLELLHRHAHQRKLIALAMGESGLAARVLAGKFGALLTFAALTPQAGSAPGQPTITELRKRYRWDRIGATTRIFGVLGWPVTHSLSPHIHNAAMAADGIDGVFLPLPVTPDRADSCAFLDYVAANPWLDAAGFSVTLPHKQNALHWLAMHGHPRSAMAQRCGAVNTLSRSPNDAWQGDNTDAAGLLAALDTIPELAGNRLNGQTVDVLGAGGAARAAAAGLLERGCHVTIYNRSPERAAALAADLGCAHAPWQNRLHSRGTVLINCTSVGLWPSVDDSPMPIKGLKPHRVVLDTVYNPPQTRLLNEAAQRGCRTVSGIEMFIGQAAQQYAHWHGRPAPTAVMRAHVSATDLPV